ncbi:MAG: DUF4366 domain-containing protein [Clostridia bacterium]|nr:DUF4366 domain-containing protein [Clostridia bacterium]
MTNKILSTICAVLCIALFCLPAYTYADPYETEDTTAAETYPPITPEGNMTVTDDLYQLIVEKIIQTGEDGTQTIESNVIENKQFITVYTRSGAEFYIIIDRSQESENVYFLNKVDDDDLFALLEAEESATPCTCDVKCAAGEVNTDCYVCKMNMKSCTGTEPVQTEPVVEPKPSEPAKSGNMLPVVILVLAAAGGAAVYFLKFRKSKPKTTGAADFDDYDYDEDDEDEIEYESEDESMDESDEEEMNE